MGQRPHIVKQSQNKGNQIKERCIAENIAGRFLISAVYRKRRSNLGQRLPQISDKISGLLDAKAEAHQFVADAQF